RRMSALGGEFNESTQHLLILADEEVCTSSALHRSRRSLRLAQRRSGHRYVAWTQLGMFSNCGRSSGFAHLRRRLVNISSTGSMPSGLSRLTSVTKIIPGKPSRLVVNTRAPHLGQKFRSRPLPDWAM